MVRFVHHARLIQWGTMKSVNFASVLFVAAALGLWAWHQVPAAERVALLLPAAVQPAVLR